MEQRPYYSLDSYYRSVFGKKTAKISLDGGFTCPNRDGTLGKGGCIFCSADGSGDFAEHATLAISQQIQQGKCQTANKWPDACYVAYFQAFTNTYAPVTLLREKYEEAIAQPQIEGLSIATRPDCVSNEILDLLQEIGQKTKLWIELGLQTANESTAKVIRRGYKNSVFHDAVIALHHRDIPVVAHVIIGLPKEDRRDILATIDYINGLPVHGVKLHLMHVLQGTDLAVLYQSGAYLPLEKETYLDLLCESISRLRPDIVIHRLTGDGDKSTLLAPLWSLDKRDVLNSLHRLLKQRGIRQGQNWEL